MCNKEMTNEQKAGAALIEYHNEIFGGVDDQFKDESLFMHFLSGVIWLFNRRFMKMISVVGKTIFWGEGQRRDVIDLKWWTFKVRAHEEVHLWDAKNNPLFWGLYLLPHLFGALLIISGAALLFFKIWSFKIWSVAISLYIVGIVFVSPLPNWLFAAYYRAWAELRAYKTNMLINYWKYGRIKVNTIEWVIKHFTTGKYFWMLPFKSYLFWKIFDWRDEVYSTPHMSISFSSKKGDFCSPYLVKLYSIMKDNDLVCDKVRKQLKGLMEP